MHGAAADHALSDRLVWRHRQGLSPEAAGTVSELLALLYCTRRAEAGHAHSSLDDVVAAREQRASRPSGG